MQSLVESLIEKIEHLEHQGADVIPWGAPVPSFGDPTRSRVATLGLNPSNREFVDENGKALEESARRFHTLQSLRIKTWSKADARHVQLILDTCFRYFQRNPYDLWFRKLDLVLRGTASSYYSSQSPACHLDLIPFATRSKWTLLTLVQRKNLLLASADILGEILKHSTVRVLILNGATVVKSFEMLTGVQLRASIAPGWTLPRREGMGVKGVAYAGYIRRVGGIDLRRDVLVLGYNHNIQSSFGVTTCAIDAINKWIAEYSSRAVV